MVGALLCGLSPQDIAQALARGSAELDGSYRGWQAAPACGLCLEDVYFLTPLGSAARQQPQNSWGLSCRQYGGNEAFRSHGVYTGIVGNMRFDSN